jgi:hypothetical protein
MTQFQDLFLKDYSSSSLLQWKMRSMFYRNSAFRDSMIWAAENAE